MSHILFASRVVSKISISLFSGNAIYQSVVEHPSMCKLEKKSALNYFRTMFKPAGVYQVASLSLGITSSLTNYYFDRNLKWLIVASVLFSIFPYTILVIGPVNRALNDPNLDRGSDKVKEYLENWGKFHSLRTLLGVVALAIVNIYL